MYTVYWNRYKVVTVDIRTIVIEFRYGFTEVGAFWYYGKFFFYISYNRARKKKKKKNARVRA